ncbi:hypothetical protein THF1C08_690011 [Vibrio jasicida]|uniref:Uncharacterized protein n=1 Tax=Vibrio jasicida TaxID=766224 RepID=A0AAU9QWS0_9VIBR|nr:hypothetical protein THF1C08_690011 [Vibrio jasicida]CAH1603562.1 hypothetical protein THF1A12_710011 [Vibrio jasicida]
MRWLWCLRWYAAAFVLRYSPLNRALCKEGEIGIILFIRFLHPSVFILVKISSFCLDSLPNWP